MRDSCHHKICLEGVPKGQYLCIKCNCTSLKDFERRVAILTQRFLEKDYDPVSLEATLNQVGNIDRDSLLIDRTNEPRSESGYATNYYFLYSPFNYQNAYCLNIGIFFETTESWARFYHLNPKLFTEGPCP